VVQVWKQKLVQMGGRVQEHKAAKGATFNHVLAADAKALLRELDAAWLHRFRGVIPPLPGPFWLLQPYLS
jgi:DNA polymerase lambda